MVCKHFLPFLRLCLYSDDYFLAMQKLISLTISFALVCAFGLIFKITALTNVNKTFLHVCSEILQFQVLKFKSLFWIGLHMVWEKDSLSFFCIRISKIIYWRDCPFPSCILDTFGNHQLIINAWIYLGLLVMSGEDLFMFNLLLEVLWD